MTEIDPKDLRIETYSAPVYPYNKSTTHVRIIHIPTGISVECKDRPPYKQQAVELLRHKIAEKDNPQ